jgi:hypothetical protein
MKALYRHKQSGDIFAIETDERGNVLSTSGPLLSRDLDPSTLDYDGYWNTEIQAKLPDFERITKADYLELLSQNGIFHVFRKLL